MTPELRSLVDSHPLRERLWAQLILALYRSGRQADALTAYDQIRRHLATELGVDPGRSLQQLRQGILRQDAGLDLDRRAGAAASVPRWSLRASARPTGTSEHLRRSHVGLPATNRAASEPARRTRLQRPLRDAPSPRLAGCRAVVVLAAMAVSVARCSPRQRGDTRVDLRSGVTMLDAGTGAAVVHVRAGQRPTDVASGAGAVWVSNATSDSVSRIDSKTRAVVPIKVGRQPAGITVGAGAVWVANGGEATVTRISTASPFDVTEIEVGPGPSDVEVAAGSVWVYQLPRRVGVRNRPADESGHPHLASRGRAGGDRRRRAVRCGSPTRGTTRSAGWIPRPAGSWTPPIRVGHGPLGVAFGAGAVWVTDNIDGSVSRIDLVDLSVTTRRLAPVVGRTAWQCRAARSG